LREGVDGEGERKKAAPLHNARVKKRALATLGEGKGVKGEKET